MKILAFIYQCKKSSSSHRMRVNANKCPYLGFFYIKPGYLLKTLPPIILNAGVPRTNVSRAKVCLQLGQVQGVVV